MNKKAVVLLSGGLDSSTLLYYVRLKLGFKDIYCLTFLYGQKHSKELKCAIWQARQLGVKEHRIVNISFLGKLLGESSALISKKRNIPPLSDIPREQRNQPPTYVPQRNLIMLAIASAFAESNGIQTVFYGAQSQDSYGYWDCTPSFVKKINGILGLNRKNTICIEAPFVGWRKKKILSTGLKLGVDYSHTWTCYVGKSQICRVCPACIERLNAFKAIGYKDPLDC